MQTKPSQRKTVLLVEDSKLQRLTSERTLSKEGYAVLTAATGEVALQLARERVPDLILLDMLLPDMGGECVLRKLKGDPATMRIPVLVLSGLSEANSTKLRQEGAADYFQKGRMFDDAQGQEAFLDMIREVLRESQVKN